jgi:hypothetical protein
VDIGTTVIVVRRLPSDLAHTVAEQIVMDDAPPGPRPTARPVRRPSSLPDDLFGYVPPSNGFERAGEGAGSMEDEY